jgi:hypothetical protein
MNAANLRLRPRELFVAILLCFLLSTFYFLYESNFSLDRVIVGIMAGRWDAPWSRGQLGGWNAFLEHLVYFGYVLPSLTVLLAQSLHPPRWVRVPVIIAFCLSLIFVTLLAQSGARRIIGVVIGGALLTWLGLQPKITFKQIVLTVAMVISILYALQGILHIRRFGLEAALEGKIPETQETSYLHVDDNFLRLSQIINLIPERFEYVGLKPFYYLIARPIPRVFWPDKPLDPGYDLPTMIEMRGAEGTSLSSSILGELYASWGMLAILIGGIIFGKLASMWNRILYRAITPNSKLLYGMGLMVFFVGIRSMQELLLMSYGVLGWVLLSLLFRKVRLLRRNRHRSAVIEADQKSWLG